MTGITEKWYLAYQGESLHESGSFEEFGERLKSQFAQEYEVQTLQAKLMVCVQWEKYQIIIDGSLILLMNFREIILVNKPKSLVSFFTLKLK